MGLILGPGRVALNKTTSPFWMNFPSGDDTVNTQTSKPDKCDGGTNEEAPGGIAVFSGGDI